MRLGAHVLLNGALLRREEARVSVDDPGFLVGDGVFETLRLYDGVPFLLEEHLDRLGSSLRHAAIAIPADAHELSRQLAADIQQLVQANQLQSGSGRLRITITRGPGAPPVPTVLVTADAWEPPDAAVYARGVEVETSVHTRRVHPWQRVKSTSYAPYLWLRREASTPGVFEVLVWNDSGRLAEGSFTNVFVVDAEGMLRTPHADDGCLEGVTRAAILRLAAAAGIDCRKGDVTHATVAGAREMFLTGSLVEVVPVLRLDGHRVGEVCPGPVTRAVHTAYRARVAQPLRNT
jgi:branched-chain amino acid aminotransferase